MPEENNRNIDEPLEPLILTVREQRVILDADLARVYGVSKGAESSGQANCKPLSAGLRIPTQPRGSSELEVTNFDFKTEYPCKSGS
jgi:hypothetical protein